MTDEQKSFIEFHKYVVEALESLEQAVRFVKSDPLLLLRCKVFVNGARQSLSEIEHQAMMFSSDSLFAVITEDRHCNAEVEVWDNKDLAIARARQIAKESCRNDSDYSEEQIEGWVFHAQYSVEGDLVRVVQCDLHHADEESHKLTNGSQGEI